LEDKKCIKHFGVGNLLESDHLEDRDGDWKIISKYKLRKVDSGIGRWTELAHSYIQ